MYMRLYIVFHCILSGIDHTITRFENKLFDSQES